MVNDYNDEKKYCNGNCSKCNWCRIVKDPTDADLFNDDVAAMFCANPNNSMELEWNPSQRKKVMENPNYAVYVKYNKWTFIAGMLRPYEVDEIHGIGNVELTGISI